MPPHPLEYASRAQAIMGDALKTIEFPPVRNPNDVRLKLILANGDAVHIREAWSHQVCVSYGYYWLDAQGGLIAGWDNAPHHPRVPTYPHHKHVPSSPAVQPSPETTLEAVLAAIRDCLTATS
jgi:hypothetical protein